MGPPWHEMPFGHGEVDWAGLAVFLHVKEAPWRSAQPCAAPLKNWSQNADVQFVTAKVADLEAAFKYLR